MDQFLNEIAELVRIATEDSEQEANPSLLRELSMHTYNCMDTIVNESSKGLISNGKNFHQIYKSLVLIEYLLVNGNQLVAEKYTDYSSLIFKLNKFNCVEKPNMNASIKEKSKKIITLLNSEDMLQEERLVAMQQRNKIFLNSVSSQNLASNLKEEEKQVEEIKGLDVLTNDNDNRSGSLYDQLSQFNIEDFGLDDYSNTEKLDSENGWTTVKEKKSKKTSIGSLISTEENSAKTDRFIIIDGSNVACNYGKNKTFATKGIIIAIKKLKQIGSKFSDINLKVKVILPSYRHFEQNDSKHPPTDDYETITELYLKDIISFTPAGQHDDTFILKFAMDLNALILSNDKFLEKKFTNNEELYRHYSKNLINFTFCENTIAMEPCPSLIREGLTLEDMIMNTNQIVPILSIPVVPDKLSATLGKYSEDQTEFRFFIRKNNSYTCDRIQLYEKRSAKHNFTYIECIKAYNQGKEIFSHGSAGNNWCSKTITLTENTLIESINVKSKKIIEKIEFRLKVNDDYKLIEIGRENDQESNSIDILSENLFGFYGSFVRIDELNCLNTFGLIFSENKNPDLPISSTNKTVINTPVIELNEKELKKTIQVPINAVGRIIGYAGFNVRKIKEDTNCKVYVDDKLGTCTLTGTRKSIKKAEQLIDLIIKTNEKKETDFVLPYRIPKKLIALVIGSSGSNLKIICNQTNCKTQIEDKQNDIGKCIVTGPIENLPRAVKSIGQLVRTAQIIEISNILRKHEIENENDLTSECILDEGVGFVRKIQVISSRKREMLETDLKESEYFMRIKNFNSNPTNTIEGENWRNFKNI